MRSFSDKEKAIINKLISIKRNSKLEELQVARLLREQLSCFAIKWTLEPKELSLYYVTIQNWRIDYHVSFPYLRAKLKT